MEAWCNIWFEGGGNPLINAHHLFLNGEEIKDLVIPNNVPVIKDYAFTGCSGINTITLPKGLQRINDGVFKGCGTISDVYCFAEKVPDTPYHWSVFEGTDIQSATLHVPGTAYDSYVATSPWSSFGTIVKLDTEINGIYYCINKDEMQATVTVNPYKYTGAVTIPETIVYEGVTCTVSSIGANAFADCEGLTSVIIPEGVTSVGDNAFMNCVALSEVSCFAENVPETSSGAFAGTDVQSAVLHVPETAVESYGSTAPWDGFGTQQLIEKCGLPTISYVDGKIVFGCETEGVIFKSNVICQDNGTHEDNTVNLSVSYLISVYAVAEGCKSSDLATATLCWIDAEPVNQVATGTLEIAAVPVLVKSRGGVITVEGVGNGTTVSVYTTGGVLVGSATAVDRTATVSTSLPTGTVVVVKIGEKAVKIVVR